MDKLDIVTDESGNKVVLLPEIIFSNKQNINWDDVEDYLGKYVGELIEIAETRDIIYIGNKFYIFRIAERSGFYNVFQRIIEFVPERSVFPASANLIYHRRNYIFACKRRYIQKFFLRFFKYRRVIVIHQVKHGKYIGLQFFRFTTIIFVIFG